MAMDELGLDWWGYRKNAPVSYDQRCHHAVQMALLLMVYQWLDTKPAGDVMDMREHNLKLGPYQDLGMLLKEHVRDQQRLS